MNKKSLGQQLNIEMYAGILFVWNMLSAIAINQSWEIIMDNSNALTSYLKAIFWCGFAFLRRYGSSIPIQTRDGHSSKCFSGKSEREKVRFLPSAPFRANTINS